MIDQINSFLLRHRGKRTQTRAQISLDQAGFTIADQHLQWQDVTKIVAHKRDCFGTDLICLLIANQSKPIEINEEAIGWQPLIDACQQNLSGMIPFEVWFPQVAFPAFNLNPTTLFDRGQME